MSNCITIFSKPKQDESLLIKDLTSYFKNEEKASFYYNNIIFNQRFQDYLDSKVDILRYKSTGEPHIDEVIEFFDEVKEYNKINKVFSVDNFETTTKEFIELSEGFSFHLMKTLHDKGFTPNDLFESRVNLGFNEDNIMNITLQKVVNDIESYHDNQMEVMKYAVNLIRNNPNIRNLTTDSLTKMVGLVPESQQSQVYDLIAEYYPSLSDPKVPISDTIDIIEESYTSVNNRISEILQALNIYSKEFYDSYNNYLDSNLNFTIDTDSILSDEIENRDDKETKDAAFNKSSWEFNTKDGAPKAIKLLIATIPQIEDGMGVPNSLGLHKLVNYNDTFNFIHQQLMDVPPDIELYINKLKERDNPEINYFIKKLNFDNDTYIPSVANPTKYDREQLLRTQFVNQFNKTNLEFMLHFKDADGNIVMKSSNLDTIYKKLISEWSNNFDIIKQENPNLFNELKAYKSQGKLLEMLGIPKGLKIPTEIIDDIYEYGLKNVELFNNIYSPPRGEGVLTKFREIADIYLQTHDDVVDFQLFNVEGNIVYGITLNTYLSSVSKELAYYAGDVDMLLEKFPELFNSPYNQNSIWLDWIMNGNNSDVAEKIYIGAYEGFKNENEGEGKVTSDLRQRDLNLQRIIGVLEEGTYPFLRSADRSTENFIGFKGSKNLIVGGIIEARRALIGYLKDEIAAMSNSLNIAHYGKNNKDFRIFHINEGDKKISLLSKFNPKIESARRNIDMNISDSKEKIEELNKALDKELAIGLENIKKIDVEDNKIIDDFITTLIEQIEEKETKQLSSSGVLMKKGEKYVYLQPLVDKYDNIETVISLFALNSFIANVEQTKIFVGDLALYKSPSDVFKRMAMLNSTKESSRTDNEFLDYLSSKEWRFSNQEKKQFTNEIVTATFNDVRSNASQFKKGFKEMMTKLFGKDADRYMKVYNDIQEGDAFAYITYDGYREFSMRFGEWLESDEVLYNKIADGDISFSSDVIRKATMKKYQYAGKLLNFQDENIIAGRKFAVMPLVPGAIPKGSVLEKLNEDMIENGVTMAFYESAAKFGHTIFENERNEIGAHSLYDENGNYHADLSDNHDILDAKYMGNQLKIHNIQKTRITASTQKRKISLSNLFENGEPIEGTEEIVNKYINIQEQIIENNYRKMIPLDENSNLLENPEQMKLFLDILLEQGISQNYTSNELKSILNLRHLALFDTSSSKQKLENLVMARLKNNVINSKRTGDSLAQAPDIAFEINQEVADNSERHNLEFYRYAKDGRMLPMEIMLGLPEELRGYVTNVYGKGKLTQEALDAFNADIAEDNKRYEKTGEMTDLTRATIYAGFRIPNQDSSSSDVAKVKSFMMPHLGGQVIVPKPIVAKTGSDFDIDKMNFYKPNIRLHYKNEYEIANDFITEKKVSEGALKTWILKQNPKANVNKNFKALKRDFIDTILITDINFIEHPVLRLINSQFNQYLKANNSKVERFTYIKSKKNISEMREDELENELLETEIELTLMKQNQKQLLAPLTDNLIKDIVAEIRSLRKDTSSNDHISDVFTNAKNVEKFIAFLSGAGGVGQVAIHRTNHVMAQKTGLKMKAINNFFVEGDLIELGRRYNDNDQLISEIISEMLTAFVDVANDPYILDINAIQSTTNTILMMLRWGLPLETTFLFINQPIIREYVKEQILNESTSSDKETGKLSKKDLVQKVLTSFDINVKDEDLIHYVETEISRGNENIVRIDKKEDYLKYNDKMLREGITKGTNQLQALDLFLEYQRQSMIFQDMIKSTSPDTSNFKNFTALENQLLLRDKVSESGMFVNYERMFDDFIGAYFHSKEKYMNLIKDLFLSQHPQYKPHLDALKNMIIDVTKGEENKNRVINTIEADFVRYILAKTGVINSKQDVVRTMLSESDHTVPKTIKKIKDYFKEEGIENAFIEEILPLLNDKGEGLDRMKTITKKRSNTQNEILTEAYKEFNPQGFNEWVKEEFGHDNFYEDLIVHQILQSGTNNSPFSYMSIIPTNDYFNFIKNSLNQAYNGSIPIQDFAQFDNGLIGEFILHHPEYFYGKYNLPFKINYNKQSKSSIFIHEDTNIMYKQLGRAHKFSLYGTLNDAIIPIDPKNEISEIMDSKHPDNPINRCKIVIE